MAGVHPRRLDERRQVVCACTAVLGMVSGVRFGLSQSLLTHARSLLVIKIILGVRLLTYATQRRAGMEAREQADRVNDFGRDPIGEGKEEQVRGIHKTSLPYLNLTHVLALAVAIQQGAEDSA